MAEQSPRDYFSALKRTFPLAVGSDPTELKKTLDMLSQTTRSRQALKALGKEEKPKTSPGLFQRLFDQRTGVLMAPARFGSALVLDVLNYDDENLRKYNPLESALRSAGGEFAITGGDVFKVEDGDSIVRRFAKFAAAFTFDVATDPTTFLGPVATFSKKAAAVSAVRNGDKILSSAVRIVGQAGGKTDTLVDDLFRRSRIFQAADTERRLGSAAAQVQMKKGRSTLDDLVDQATGAKVGENPMSLLQMGADGVVPDSIKLRIANAEMGRIVGESFLTGGRVRLRKELSGLLGSEDLARKLFRELPDELAGGLFIKTATGRPVARIAGGRGGSAGMLGEAVEKAASAKFALTATGAGNWVSKYFGGRTGALYAQTKRGLVKGLDDVNRSTLLDYVSYKKAVQERGLAEQAFSLRTKAVVSTVLSARHEAGPQNKQAFDGWLQTYFEQPSAMPSELATGVEREAHAAANKLRVELNAVADELRAAGIDIGDLGPDYSPLMLTKKEAERILLEEYRGTGLAPDTMRYNPTQVRESWVAIIPDPEMRKKIGNDVLGLENAVFLNASSINKILGRPAFETDPLRIVERYFDYAANSLAAIRFNKVAMESGALFRFPAESKKVLDMFNLAAFMSEATSKATPAARKKAQTLLDRARKELDQALSESELRRVQREVAVTRNQALQEYEGSKSAVAEARRAVVEAEREVAEATRQYEVALRQQTAQNLSQYGDTGMQQAVAEWRRIRNNASARLSKAKARVEEALAATTEAAAAPKGSRNRRINLRETAEETRARIAKMEEETISLEDARAQLSEAQAYREQVLPTFVERQMSASQAAFSRYEQALARRASAVEALDGARATRDQAQKKFQAASRNTSIGRAKAVDVLTETYVQAKMQFDELAMQIGRVRVKDMAPADAARYRAAKETLKQAKKMLQDSLGYARNAKVRDAGTVYAETIIELANVLSAEQLAAARVFASADAMDGIVSSLYNAADDTVMGAIGDMVTIYSSLRRYLEPVDLKKLNAAERAVLTADPKEAAVLGVPLKDVKAADLVKDGKPQVAAAGNAMYSKGGFRQVGASEPGAQMSVPRSLQDTWAPGGVADVIESYYRAREFPSEWERHMRKIYDPLMMVWKGTATVGRGPAYVLLNTVGGLSNNFLARVSARSHKLSASMVRATSDALRKVTRENPTKGYLELIPLIEAELRRRVGNVTLDGMDLVDLYSDFLARGGHFSNDLMAQSVELQQKGLGVTGPFARQRTRTIMTQEGFATEPNKAQRLANAILSNPYQMMMNDMATASEIYIRFAAFVDGWQRFKNLDDAFDLTTMLHFDYQDLSEVEVWLKRFIPFYTWSRNNIPLQIRASFTSYDQFGKLVKANEEFKAAFSADDEWLNDYLPEYIETVGGFVSSFKFGGNHLALFNKLPMADVDKLFQVVDTGGIPMVAPRLSELANLSGPTIKTPLELLLQRNFQYGQQYNSFAESLGEQTESLLPQWQIVKRALSSAGLPVEQERRYSNLFQLLVGAPYGATTYTQGTLRGAAIERNKALSKQVREAAAEAGVDVEWLRKQIADGNPMSVIAARAAMGQGNPAMLNLQKWFSGTEVTRGDTDYNALLRSLERGNY
jgi:hypothetical protein